MGFKTLDSIFQFFQRETALMTITETESPQCAVTFTPVHNLHAKSFWHSG